MGDGKNIKLDTDTARAIVRALSLPEQAALFNDSETPQEEIKVLPLALDTAKDPKRPFRVPYQFKSFVVLSATDAGTTVNIRINTIDDGEAQMPLTLKEGLVLGRRAASAYLDWPAQPGKSITIAFFLHGQYQSTKMLLQSTGAVSVSEGTTPSHRSIIIPGDGAAHQVLAADTTRASARFYNNTGQVIYEGCNLLVRDRTPDPPNANGYIMGIPHGIGETFSIGHQGAITFYVPGGGELILLSATN